MNLPYVLWIAAYNTSFVLGYLLVEMHFFPGPVSRRAHAAPQGGPLAEAHTQTQTAYALVPPLLARAREGLSEKGGLRRTPSGYAKLEVPTHHAEEGAAGEVTAAGPPVLLEAVNRNGLVLFLVVRAVSVRVARFGLTGSRRMWRRG